MQRLMDQSNTKKPPSFNNDNSNRSSINSSVSRERRTGDGVCLEGAQLDGHLRELGEEAARCREGITR
jgi:hypothetical protein